ncbi:MAG: peptidylprolyl isomerase [Flavobacteriales bacterium]|nr:peptidylprolyl isomerase [Flavobacteriales bacterium]
MKVLTYLFAIAMLFSACGTSNDSGTEGSTKDANDNSSSESIAKAEKEKDTDSKDEGSSTVVLPTEFPILNDGNAVEFLTKYGKEHPENNILMETNYGNITLELFDDVPIHRANFLYLVNRGYYDPTEILRVIKGFMIQGGNSEEELSASKRMIIGAYCLPEEMSLKHPHFRGALAMSRTYTANPEKCSSAYDFYIVHGTKYKEVHLFQKEEEYGIKYSDSQRKKYKSTGGALHLDMEHTVFGQVTAGFDVLDKIANVEVDEGDWPKKQVTVKMSVVKN